MNVKYITNSIIPANDAQSIQINEMCIAFHKKLLDKFTLISPLTDENLHLEMNFKWCRICTFKVRKRSLRYFVFILKLFFINSAKVSRSDIIFTRDVVVALTYSIIGNKVFFEVHKDPQTKFSYLSFLLMRRLKKLKLICITFSLKNYFMEELKFKENSCLVLHDGFNPENYILPPSENIRDELFPVPQEKIIIVHTGSIYKGRGFEMIEYLLQRENVVFYQIGGQQKDIKYWKERLKNYKNIFFINKVSRVKVAEYQRNADLLFYTISKRSKVWWCTSPLKVFEYLASGKSILATRLGSVLEVLNDNNSYLFFPGNKDSLMKAFFEFENNQKSRSTRQSCIEEIIDYSWDNRVNSILNHANSFY